MEYTGMKELIEPWLMTDLNVFILCTFHHSRNSSLKLAVHVQLLCYNILG